MRGSVYILSNRAMPGLLKVGYTTRSVHERLDELNSTGVPTSFVIEFCIEVDDAPRGESVLHRALGKHHYEKEFFKVTVSKAVEASKKMLESETFTVYGIAGRAKDLYLTDAEKESLQRQAEESQAKKRVEDELKRRQEAEAKALGEEFLSLCYPINMILKAKSVLGTGGFARQVVGMALFFSIVGAGLADKVDPVPRKDGEMMVRKLTQSEKELFQRFFICVNRLIELNAFSKFANRWHEGAKPDDYITVQDQFRGGYERTASDLLSGVFLGLGLRLG